MRCESCESRPYEMFIEFGDGVQYRVCRECASEEPREVSLSEAIVQLCGSNWRPAHVG